MLFEILLLGRNVNNSTKWKYECIFYGFVNLKTNLKQFAKQYENTLRKKVELEWEENAKCFSKKTPCVTRYEMEKQVEEVYTISKFKEFQQELIALMYCDIINFVGSIYEISELLLILVGT